MRVAFLGFTLAGLGHLAYVPGELDPITFSTIFDLLTGLFLLVAAWAVREEDELPRALAWAFIAFAVVKLVDLLASLVDGIYPFHLGWAAIAFGTTLLAWGAVRDEATPWRAGAAMNAFGSLVYVALVMMDLVAGDDANLFFLVGAGLAVVGWTVLTWRAPVA